MTPQITLHYRLSEDAQRQHIAANADAHRHHAVTITRDDTTDEVWQRLAAHLTWGENGSTTVASTWSNRKKGLDEALAGFPDADGPWSPAEAAEALYDYLEPAARLADEAAQLREGRWPDAAPEALSRLLPDGLPARDIDELLRRVTTPPLVNEDRIGCEVAGLSTLSADLRDVAQELVTHSLSSEAGLEEAQQRFGGRITATVSQRHTWPILVRLVDSTLPAEAERILTERREARVAAERASREAKEAREQAAAEQRHAEAVTWISEHGSERLRRIVDAELLETSWAVYEDERLTVERPGWYWPQLQVDGEFLDVTDLTEAPRNVPELALDLRDAAAAVDAAAELSFVRVPSP